MTEEVVVVVTASLSAAFTKEPVEHTGWMLPKYYANCRGSVLFSQIDSNGSWWREGVFVEGWSSTWRNVVGLLRYAEFIIQASGDHNEEELLSSVDGTNYTCPSSIEEQQQLWWLHPGYDNEKFPELWQPCQRKRRKLSFRKREEVPRLCEPWPTAASFPILCVDDQSTTVTWWQFWVIKQDSQKYF